MDNRTKYFFYKQGSSGYSQPLVRIKQTTAWNSNYALQIVGYFDFDSLRINGQILEIPFLQREIMIWD
jgi:hypothetical protein